MKHLRYLAMGLILCMAFSLLVGFSGETEGSLKPVCGIDECPRAEDAPCRCSAAGTERNFAACNRCESCMCEEKPCSVHDCSANRCLNQQDRLCQRQDAPKGNGQRGQCRRIRQGECE